MSCCFYSIYTSLQATSVFSIPLMAKGKDNFRSSETVLEYHYAPSRGVPRATHAKKIQRLVDLANGGAGTRYFVLLLFHVQCNVEAWQSVQHPELALLLRYLYIPQKASDIKAVAQILGNSSHEMHIRTGITIPRSLLPSRSQAQLPRVMKV